MKRPATEKEIREQFGIPAAYLAQIRDQIKMDALTITQQKHRAGEFRYSCRDAVTTDIYWAHEEGRELDPREVY